jgi:hypothetical protein
MEVLIVGGLFWCLFWAFACAFVAQEKRRSTGAWFAMGLVFGILGFLPLAAVPPLPEVRRIQQ